MEVGNPAIVAAINYRVFCEIQADSQFSVELQDFGLNARAEFHHKSLEWTTPLPAEQKQIFIFAQKAIECTLKYLPRFTTFKLSTWSDSTNIKGQKMGFGTSAAAVVAIVAAILKFHRIDITTNTGKEIVFKLATIAHFQAQGNIGSGFDVAASTWGGIILYRRFDPFWLETQIKKPLPLKEIVEQSWPQLQVEPLSLLPRLHLLVGWTGSPASTVKLVDQVSKKPGRIAIYNKIAQLVTTLLVAWKANNEQEILALVKQNEMLLRELGEKTGVNIETPTLCQLSDLANDAGAAGKLSGAGGGDCGFAITFTPKIISAVKKAWQAAGIQIIDVRIDERGIT